MLYVYFNSYMPVICPHRSGNDTTCCRSWVHCSVDLVQHGKSIPATYLAQWWESHNVTAAAICNSGGLRAMCHRQAGLHNSRGELCLPF